MKLSEMIQALIDNPDDVSVLPQIKEMSVEYESSEVDYQTKIDKLQQVNRNLLKQIPQPEEPAQPEQTEEVVENENPTMSDAIAAMENLLGGQ